MPKVRKPFISGEEFQSLLDWIKGTIRVIHGKGQKERSVPFDKDAQRVVLRYLNQRSDSEPWLWVGEERRRLQYYGIGQDILRMMQRAKVDVKDAYACVSQGLGRFRCSARNSSPVRSRNCWLVNSHDDGSLCGSNAVGGGGDRGIPGVQAVRSLSFCPGATRRLIWEISFPLSSQRME